MPNLSDIDRLLSEDEWVRRLARRLVADPHLADDLAQDVWVTALIGRGGARSLRPWLGGVLRNLLGSFRRDERRRVHTEEGSARCEALPSAAEVHEEVSLRRELATHLLELEEPYRTTLHLRFLRDQPLKRIAASMNVPISTVHDRVQRGLEMMRVRLDRDYGGKRDSWGLALSPLLGHSLDPAANAIRGIVMSAGLKVTASLLVVGGISTVWWQARDFQDSSPVVPGTPTVLPGEVVSSRPIAKPPELASAETRAEVPAAESAAATPVLRGEDLGAASPVSETIELRGQVIDTSQEPVADLRIGFEVRSGEPMRSTTLTGSDGRFALERTPPQLGAWASVNPLYSKTIGGRFLIGDPELVLLALGIQGTDELVLVVEPALGLTGQVVDVRGDPIPDAKLVLRVHQELYRELGFSHFTATAEQGTWATVTDEWGGFSIVDSCGGEYVFLDVGHVGYASKRVDLSAANRHDLVVVLEPLADTVEVTGHVVDDHGGPVEGARVSMGREITKTDERGAFALMWSLIEPPNDSFEARAAVLEVKEEDDLPTKGPVRCRVAAIKEGFAPTQLELEEVDLTLPLVLQLGSEPLSITGKILNEEGRPLSGIAVWAANLTPFGYRELKLGEDSTRLAISLEEELRGGLKQRGVLSDADGAFKLEGLRPHDYDVRIYDPRSASFGEGWTLPAGTRGAELVLVRDSSITRVAGRIVSVEGLPHSDITIQVRRAGFEGGIGRTTGPPDRLLEVQSTDADGRFEFPELATDGTSLLLLGHSLFVRSVDLRDHADLANMVIVEPLLFEMQIDFSTAPQLADQVRVLDGNGDPLSVVESFGSLGNSSSTSVPIENGSSRVLRVPETARTLVLMRQGDVVSRRPLDLDPAQRVVVRP